MTKPTLGWQSWSPPYPRWHGLPRWDYSPYAHSFDPATTTSSRPLKKSIRYWCSWYAAGTNVSDKLLAQTLQTIEVNQLAFTHLLIDDGWCPWGDWLSPSPAKFPDLSQTIAAIHQAGFKVGLWFAPFLADPKSALSQHHPDWFVKQRGRPVQGFKTVPVWEAWVKPRYLLDFSLPAVQNYAKSYLKLAIETWRVDLLKLDFLYAPYFHPNPTTPSYAHDQITWLLSYLKSTYPQVQTIACGAPFADCNQLVDAIRISKDTALPPLAPRWLNQLVYTQRVNMLHTTLQANRHPQLNVDPDVRMFTLDNATTNSRWNSIATPIIGIGDNLVQYDQSTMQKAKLWLKNHSSPS